MIVETRRLILRPFTVDDAAFMTRQLTDPSFVTHVGDRGVRTHSDAVAYIQERILPSYDRHGFGMLLVTLRDDGAPIGIAGLLKRESLDDVDLGYAILPEYRGKGYAVEAARGVMDHAAHDLGLLRLVAIVAAGNDASRAVLLSLGMCEEGRFHLASPGEQVLVYGRTINTEKTG